MRPRKSVAPLIRCGGDHDGGYLIPNDFDGITHCISPGVAETVTFDDEMAERGIDVLMVDASVDGPPTPNPKFHFQKKFLGLTDDEMTTRLDSLVALAGPDAGDMILEMDIEGAEWPILLDASVETLARFRVMVIEFHGMHNVFSAFDLKLIAAAFDKVLSTHHVVHVHANNCRRPRAYGGFSVPPLTEITLYRKDRPFAEGVADALPHALDMDCVPNRPSIVWPRHW